MKTPKIRVRPSDPTRTKRAKRQAKARRDARKLKLKIIFTTQA